MAWNRIIFLALAGFALAGCPTVGGFTFTHTKPAQTRVYGDLNDVRGLTTERRCGSSYSHETVVATLGGKLVDDRAWTRDRNHCTVTNEKSAGIVYDPRRQEFGEIVETTTRRHGTDRVTEEDQYLGTSVTETHEYDDSRKRDQFHSGSRGGGRKRSWRFGR